MPWHSASSPKSRRSATSEHDEKIPVDPFRRGSSGLLRWEQPQTGLRDGSGGRGGKIRNGRGVRDGWDGWNGKTVGEIPDSHTAETSLDYLGTYEGTLPGADCPGIRTTIVLAADGSYALHMEYLERDSAFDEKGTFKVEGNLLTLTPSDGGQIGYYKVEENRLRHLDADRQPIAASWPNITYCGKNREKWIK